MQVPRTTPYTFPSGVVRCEINPMDTCIIPPHHNFGETISDRVFTENCRGGFIVTRGYTMDGISVCNGHGTARCFSCTRRIVRRCPHLFRYPRHTCPRPCVPAVPAFPAQVEDLGTGVGAYLSSSFTNRGIPKAVRLAGDQQSQDTGTCSTYICELDQSRIHISFGLLVGNPI